ncbi:caspase-7-like [Glandiceps talaboti]
MFFIQACQGDEEPDLPMQFPPSDAKFGGVSAKECERYRPVPVWSDFLLGYSTFPGCKSFRYPDSAKGSYYIGKVVKCIKEYHKSLHLLDILTRVNREVAEESGMMVPAPLFTLTKSVYF